MDQGPPDTKRPRLSTGPSWSAGGTHHGVSLLHPAPSPTAGQLPHHPPLSTQYQQPQLSPLSFSRPLGPGDHPHPHPPHPHSHPHPHAPPPAAHAPHPHPHSQPPTPHSIHAQPQPQPQLHPPAPGASHTALDDRRQHESDRFPPMQDHRQPPHSPAHPPFPPYGHREPMIKADPAGAPDDNSIPPQLRRPLSTGAGVSVKPQDSNMTPVTPHSAVPPPPHSQPFGDDRRHMSFDNGPQQQQQQQQQQPPHQQPPHQQPQQPVYSRQASYQPQTPLSHAQPYDYPPQYASHSDLPYPIQVAAASGKRKAQRASQACDMCRQLKAKCDELKPCKSCKEKNFDCKYRETVPKQQDKIAADILDTLVSIQNRLEARFDSFDQRMRRLECAVLRNGSPGDLPPDPMVEDEDRPDSAASAPATAADGQNSASPGEEPTALLQPPMNSVEARSIARKMEEEKEVEPGPVVRPGAVSIPVNHTTLAAFLLRWRPIEFLVGDILESENVKYIGEFPIRQEEKRGLLRIWGRGEGLEASLRVDKADKEALRDAGVMEMLDDVSDAGAPSPGDCWGGIGSSPAPVDGKPVIALQAPDFSESVVWKYVKSYQDNIQNMHPLIIPLELKAMVKIFLDTVQQTASTRSSRNPNVAKFVATPAAQPESGVKRKRSPGPEGAESPSSSPKSSKPVFQRSINNALVLLVLALGKVCLVKDKIPDVVPVSEPPQHGSPLARNGYPASPVQGSSPSYATHSHSAGLPSPKDGIERPGPSRRASFQGAGTMKGATSLKRNMDVIPGLDYFAYATDILGGQIAGTSLRHIHAYILAGLYHGQLGRVLESYAYIKEAGYALQAKLRPSLDRFRKLQELGQEATVTEKSDNQLVFAFWTCLQLESDIIAELPLPQTHILAYEEIMPYPNIQMAKNLGFEELVLQSYLAQLYLRKKLNQIHGMLYNPEKPLPIDKETGTPIPHIIDYIQETIDMQFVPPEFKFERTDPPAGDILSARLRAKFWGAQVITYRPFVRQILEVNFQKMFRAEDDQSTMPRSDIRSGVIVPVLGPDNDIPQTMIDYAIKGTLALIESTRAFHGLKEKRYVVTNIFGTAHAQWGNLVTLAAIFRDPILHAYVDENVLRGLFARTISFFKIIAPPSSSLHVDLRILEGLERKLWGRSSYADPMDHPTSSSFSSSASGGPPPAPSMGPAPPPPNVPIAGPPGVHSPIRHLSNGMMSMSPPLPSPHLVPMSAGAVPGPPPMTSPEGAHGSHSGQQHPGMLPPGPHHPPHY